MNKLRENDSYHFKMTSTIQYNAIHYNTMPYNTTQYTTIQYNAINYNTRPIQKSVL